MYVCMYISCFSLWCPPGEKKRTIPVLCSLWSNWSDVLFVHWVSSRACWLDVALPDWDQSQSENRCFDSINCRWVQFSEQNVFPPNFCTNHSCRPPRRDLWDNNGFVNLTCSSGDAAQNVKVWLWFSVILSKQDFCQRCCRQMAVFSTVCREWHRDPCAVRWRRRDDGVASDSGTVPSSSHWVDLEIVRWVCLTFRSKHWRYWSRGDAQQCQRQ